MFTNASISRFMSHKIDRHVRLKQLSAEIDSQFSQPIWFSMKTQLFDSIAFKAKCSLAEWRESELVDRATKKRGRDPAILRKLQE